jgi:predicted SnoaL-like aldol condensation-catalyzing enzyme
VEALVRKVFELIDANEWDRLDDVFAPDFVDHMGGASASGIDEFLGAIKPFYEMAPGLRHELYDFVPLTPELVMFTAHARSEGRLDVVAANTARVAGGRIREHWGPGERVMSQIMQQLGVPAA